MAVLGNVFDQLLQHRELRCERPNIFMIEARPHPAPLPQPGGESSVAEHTLNG